MNLQLAQWAHRFVCRDLKFAIENGSNRDYLAARRAVRRSTAILRQMLGRRCPTCNR